MKMSHLLLTAATVLASTPAFAQHRFTAGAACVPADPSQNVVYSANGGVTSGNGATAVVRCAIPREVQQGTTASVGTYVEIAGANTVTCSLTKREPFTNIEATTSASVVGPGHKLVPTSLSSMVYRDVLTLTCALPPSSELVAFSYREQ